MKRAIDILYNYIVNGGVGRNGGEIELIQIPLEDFDAAIERGLSTGLSSMNFERDAETKAPGIVYRLSEYSLGSLGHFTIKRVTQRSINWSFSKVPTPSDTELENWLKRMGKNAWDWLAKQREWPDWLLYYGLDGSCLSEAERLKVARQFLYGKKLDYRFKVLTHLCEMLRVDVLYRVELTNDSNGLREDNLIAHRTYNLRQVRALLTDIFNEDDLRNYCLDKPLFRPVYDELKDTDRKSEIIRRMLDYAARKGVVPELLEWTKAENPTRYAEGEPYETNQPAKDR